MSFKNVFHATVAAAVVAVATIVQPAQAEDMRVVQSGTVNNLNVAMNRAIVV